MGRNLIRLFTNHGFCVLSGPLFGDPVFGMPNKTPESEDRRRRKTDTRAEA